MGKKKYYTENFRQQALEKAYNRGDRTVQSVAEELNIDPWTLKNWMKLPRDSIRPKAEIRTKRPQDWTQRERFQLILDSQGKEGEALHGAGKKAFFPIIYSNGGKHLKPEPWTTLTSAHSYAS